jgi:Zinc-binding loop region of homing endonuclease
MPKGKRGTRAAIVGLDLKKLTDNSGRITSLNREECQRLAKYYNDELAAATRDDSSIHKCLIARCHRSEDGYGVVKVSFDTEVDRDGETVRVRRVATPRVYTLRPFAFPHERFARGDEDWSHLCHNGAGGCIDPTHITVETKKANLNRKDCHKTTQCPCCSTRFWSKKCTCAPSCFQPPL